MSSQSTENRISSVTKMLMIGTALLVDFFEFLIAYTGIGLFTGILTSTFSWMVFIPWFWMHGVSFSKHPEHMKTSALWYIIGWILSPLPEFTIGVYKNIKIAEEKDNERAKKKENEKNKNTRQTPRYANTS